MLTNSTFLSAPGPGWATPSQAVAPAIPPASPGPVDPARAFDGWAGMSPGRRSKAIRNAGLLAARLAGVPPSELAPAAGLVRSQVTTILRELSPPN